MKNIVMIYCDELRCDALSCYGNPYGIQTPNIDEIAAHGVLFENCYCSSPVCVPSRYAMLTSCSPIKTGVYHNEAAMPCFQLAEEHLTFTQVLSAEGYRTASFGKTHLPKTVKPIFDYNDERGGEMNLGINLREEASHIMKLPGQFQSVLAADYPEHKKYTPKLITDYGIEWMLEQKAPFFIRFSYLQPHTPIVVPPEYVHRLDGIHFDSELKYTSTSQFEKRFSEICDIKQLTAEDVVRMRKYYYALVLWIDDQVGRILQTLKKHDLMKDTILVFTADHGANRGENGALAKQTFQRASHRIPLLIKHGTASVRRKDICSNLDIGPTLLAMNDIDIPEAFEGFDLFAAEQEEVYSLIGYGKRSSYAFPNKRQGSYSETQGWPQRACIRTVRYRLDMNVIINDEWVCKADEDIYFTDRLKDPQEAMNLIHEKEYQPVIQDLYRKLKNYCQRQKQVDESFVLFD